MSKTKIKVNSEIQEGGFVDLLLRRNLLKDIISIFPFIIVGLDKNLNLIFYNDVAEEYFGYKRDEILKTNFVNTFVRSNNRNEIKEVLENVIKTLEIKGFIETPMFTKVRKLRFVNFILMLVLEDGKFKALLMAGSDNTKRQVAKMKIDKICEELIEKNEELNLLHKQLQGRDKRLLQLKNNLKKIKQSSEKL